MEIRYLDRRTAPHLSTLVLATSISALSQTILLPSLPHMARHFDVGFPVIQLTVSLYLLAMATIQLFIGPASDRYGRRPVLLFGLGVFVFASFAAPLAPNIHVLLILRMMQAFAAAGLVLSRAIVRDTVSVDRTASRLGYILMGMTLAPMIGPVIGGFLDERYGWQASFVVAGLFGILVWLSVWFDLGETNRYRSSSIAAQFRTYPALLRSLPFWAYSLICAFASGAFFAFIGGGAYVAVQYLDMTPSAYGLYFAGTGIGYMLGNFLSGRFAGHFGIITMVVAGTVVALLSMAAALLFVALDMMNPLTIFLPMGFVSLGNGLTLPSANAGLVSAQPRLAGSASGLGGAFQIGGGALMSVLGGLWLTPSSGPAPLLWVMFASGATGLLVSLALPSLKAAAREEAP